MLEICPQFTQGDWLQYGSIIVRSAEAHSLVTVHMLFSFKSNTQWRTESKFTKANNTSKLFSGVSLMSSRPLNR